MNVALIDYGAGNLCSVANALRSMGVDPRIVTTAEGLEGATHLVLPGVGSFGDSMAQLQKRGLVDSIRDWARSGKPYLGICLGYQLLFDSSEESPGVEGLGVLPGCVRRFQESPGLKIPHMGWNSVSPRRIGQGMWQGLGEEPYFYYVHSYFPVPADPAVIAGETSYGKDRFAAAVELGKLWACQFHPEKSQDAGIALIRNFLAL